MDLWSALKMEPILEFMVSFEVGADLGGMVSFEVGADFGFMISFEGGADFWIYG